MAGFHTTFDNNSTIYQLTILTVALLLSLIQKNRFTGVAEFIDFNQLKSLVLFVPNM